MQISKEPVDIERALAENGVALAPGERALVIARRDSDGGTVITDQRLVAWGIVLPTKETPSESIPLTQIESVELGSFAVPLTGIEIPLLTVRLRGGRVLGVGFGTDSEVLPLMVMLGALREGRVDDAAKTPIRGPDVARMVETRSTGGAFRIFQGVDLGREEDLKALGMVAVALPVALVLFRVIAEVTWDTCFGLLAIGMFWLMLAIGPFVLAYQGYQAWKPGKRRKLWCVNGLFVQKKLVREGDPLWDQTSAKYEDVRDGGLSDSRWARLAAKIEVGPDAISLSGEKMPTESVHPSDLRDAASWAELSTMLRQPPGVIL